MTDEPTAAGQAMVRALLAAHAGLREDLATMKEALRALRVPSPESAAQAKTLVNGLTMRQNAWHLRSFCDFYCHKVEAHHSIEDSRIFPAVLGIAPELAPVVDRLEADHRHLGDLLGALEGAMAALPGPPAYWKTAEKAVNDLAEHLETHLDLEEDTVIPHLARLPGWI